MHVLALEVLDDPGFARRLVVHDDERMRGSSSGGEHGGAKSTGAGYQLMPLADARTRIGCKTPRRRMLAAASSMTASALQVARGFVADASISARGRKRN
jgi:hypothetical protein